MKITTDKLTVIKNAGHPLIILPCTVADVEHIPEGMVDIEIKKHRKKRSLDANAYLWVLLGEMADKLQTNKDELYLIMLGRYGVYTHVIIKPEACQMFEREWRLAKCLGDVTVNGVCGRQYQVYFGSSTYDTKQFSTLLNGVVDEAKAIGVQTEPQEIIDSYLEHWGR